MAALLEEAVDLKDTGEEQAHEVSLVPKVVQYCSICSLPPEFCKFGPCYERCLPWLRENRPDLLSEEDLQRSLAAVSLEGVAKSEEATEEGGDAAEGSAAASASANSKKKGKKTAGPPEVKVIIAKIQRQKRKYVTAVAGLETVPDLRLKDATKLMGKKFSSGASVNETPSGAKEVVIQGDFIFELPEFLIQQLKVPASAIFILEDKVMRPYL